MNVFKTYSIFMVLIFILSLKKLNAPPKIENKADNEIARELCASQIKEIFGDNDLLKYAKLAFEYMMETEDNGCYYSLNDQECCSNVCAYYKELKKHLISNGITDVKTFCDEYDQILKNKDNCVPILHGCYGDDKHVALEKMFSSFVYRILPKVESVIKGGHTIYMPVEYFNRVKAELKLNIATPTLVSDEITFRDQCVAQIKEIFEDDDLLENAKLAFEYIIDVEENSCYHSLFQQEVSRNACAYYKEFKNHLLSYGVPNAQSFCNEYKGTNPDDCVRILNESYGPNKQAAVKKMFCEFAYRTIPTAPSVTNDGIKIDMPKEYFYRAKSQFRIRTVCGMLPPEPFCERLHEKTQK